MSGSSALLPNSRMRALRTLLADVTHTHGLRDPPARVESIREPRKSLTANVRSLTGHLTDDLTEHYSHIEREEKLAAAQGVLRLVTAPAAKTRKSDHRSGHPSDGRRTPG